MERRYVATYSRLFRHKPWVYELLRDAIGRNAIAAPSKPGKSYSTFKSRTRLDRRGPAL